MSDVPADRMVEFKDAFKLGLTNYAQFHGRSSRGAYWWYALWILMISIGLAIIDGILFSGFVRKTGGDGPIQVLFSLGMLLPNIGIGVRRLHDVGRSGWWTLIAFTVIGILLLLYWAVQPGQRQENVFGPDKEAGR
ncbi:MAG: DUF805 domain-containing protein [Parvularculaceae bacterium]